MIPVFLPSTSPMTTKLYLYILAIVSLLLGLSLFAPVQAHAANPPDQTVKNYQASGSFEGMPSFALGTGLSGTVNTFIVNIYNASSSPITYTSLLPRSGGVNGYITLSDNAQTAYTFYCPEGGVIPAGTNDVVWEPCPGETAHVWNSADNQLLLQANGPSGYGKPPWYIMGTSATVTGYNPQSGNTMLAPYILWNQVGPPDGDGNTSTHVIRITSPALYSTVSSSTPFAVDFDIEVNATTTEPNAYQIEYRNDLSGEYRLQRGYLVDAGWSSGDTPFTVSTTTQLTSEGTWSMSVQLGIGYTLGVEGGPGLIDEFYSVGPPLGGHRFSVDYEDNVSHYEYPGLGLAQFASTSCEVNFLGSDFDLGNCIGYLVQPASSTMAQFSNLTLANSAPFSYAYGVAAMRDELFTADPNGTTTVAVTVPGFGTITFLSAAMIAAVPFSATIKLILAALMWLLTIEVIYLSVIRSHNQNTGV